MADLTDAAFGLASAVTSALYPETPVGDAASPVAGVPVLIMVGWPESKSLDDYLRKGWVMVSVFATPTQRVLPAEMTRWEELSRELATYTLTREGQVVTVGGAAPSSYRPQNLMMNVNGSAFTHQALAAQAPSDVAEALRVLLVAAGITATRTGAALTLPDLARIGPLRVGVRGTSSRVIRRQSRVFQVIIWAPSPEARKAVAEPIDVALQVTPWLELPDGSDARLSYGSALELDEDQKQNLWRRDLLYTLEYPTLQTELQTEIVAFTLNVRDAQEVVFRSLTT